MRNSQCAPVCWSARKKPHAYSRCVREEITLPGVRLVSAICALAKTSVRENLKMNFIKFFQDICLGLFGSLRTT